jgi:hypothetical protein
LSLFPVKSCSILPHQLWQTVRLPCLFTWSRRYNDEYKEKYCQFKKNSVISVLFFIMIFVIIVIIIFTILLNILLKSLKNSLLFNKAVIDF